MPGTMRAGKLEFVIPAPCPSEALSEGGKAGIQSHNSRYRYDVVAFFMF